jgi:MoxR-like ATPase
MTTNAGIAKLNTLVDELSDAFLERRSVAISMVLALLAREHVLLLGPPGTAKSAMAKCFASAFSSPLFARLLTKFSVPDELFGPPDLGALDRGEFKRAIEGYLPTVRFCFLDECFKASSPILNALLSILNERIFDDGATQTRAPLEMGIGASNELPESGAGLEALFDRFLVRLWVGYVADDDAFESLLTFSGEPEILVRVSDEELELARAAVDAVDVRPVVRAVIEIRNALKSEHEIEPSDRTWRKAMKLVRARAALSGRAVATPADLMVLADVLWTEPDQRAAILGTISEKALPALREALRVLDVATETFGKLDVKKLRGNPNDLTGADHANLAKARRELSQVFARACTLTDGSPEVAEVVTKIKAMTDEVGRFGARALGLDTRGVDF